MNRVFENNYLLGSFNSANYVTSQVQTFNKTFNGCSSLGIVAISFTSATDITGMFSGCSALVKLK